MPINPDAASILEAVQHLKAYYGPGKDMMRAFESLYWLEFTYPNPTNIEPVIPPTAKVIVQDIQDRVAAEFPIIRQPPRADNMTAKKQADRVTMGLEVLWRRMPIGLGETDRGVKTLVRDVIYEGCVKGQYCVQSLYREDAWKMEPITPVRPADSMEQFAIDQGKPGDATPLMAIDFISAHTKYSSEKSKYKEQHDVWQTAAKYSVPFRMQPVLMDYVYPSLDGTYILKVYRRTIGDILYYWPELVGKLAARGDMRRETDTVEWVECWTKKWCVFLADGVIAKKKTDHGYGFNPFTIDGFWKNTNRHSADRNRIQKGYESLYSGLTSVLRAEVALETLAQGILENDAWPATDVFTDSHDTIDYQTGPDAVNMLGPNDKVERSNGKGPNQALVAMLDRHKSAAQQAVGSSMARQVAGGRESGYSRAIQAQFARLKDQPVEEALGTTLSTLSEHALMLTVNKVQTKVFLLGPWRGEDVEAALDPKDIGEHFRVEAELKAVQPMDEAQRLNTGIMLYEAGGISLETLATEYGGRRDFNRQLKQRIREKVIMSDVVQAALEELFMKGYGLPQPAEQAYEAAVAAAKSTRSESATVPMENQGSQSPAGAPGAAIPGSPLEMAQQMRMQKKAIPGSPEGAPPLQPRQGRNQSRGTRGGKRRGNSRRPQSPPVPVPYRK